MGVLQNIIKRAFENCYLKFPCNHMQFAIRDSRFFDHQLRWPLEISPVSITNSQIAFGCLRRAHSSFYFQYVAKRKGFLSGIIIFSFADVVVAVRPHSLQRIHAACLTETV